MSNVPELSDAKLYSKQLPSKRDHSEDAGFIVTASADGYDVYLYAVPYVVSGGEGGIWIVPDGRINGTIFFAIPSEQRGQGLHDNRFFRAGWHLPEYLKASDHEIVEKPDRVTWRLGGRSYAWTREGWEVTGTHAGVTTNLRFRPVGEPAWRWGPWEELSRNDAAGYKVACLVDGTIEAGGTTFKVHNGFATHERAAVGQSRDIVAEVGVGSEVFAFEIRDKDLEINIHRHTGRRMQGSSVAIKGQAYYFGDGVEGSRLTIETVEHWQDPRSGLSVPARWHVGMSSPQGIADLAITSSGRSYFHYNTGAGVMVMMQILGVANGVFHHAGGGSTAITDAIVGLRWGRGLLFADEKVPA